MHICTCYVCIANSPNCDHSAGGYSAKDAMVASILNMIYSNADGSSCTN